MPKTKTTRYDVDEHLRTPKEALSNFTWVNPPYAG